MEKPAIKDKLHIFFVLLLFASGLVLNSFLYYAKLRFGWGEMLNELINISVLSLILYSSFKTSRFEDISITQKLRLSLLLVILIYVVGYACVATVQPEFITPRYAGGFVMKPNSWAAVMVANIIGMVALACLCVCLAILRSLIFYRRKKNTPTNFYIFVFFGALTMLSAAMAGRPLKYDLASNHVMTSILLVVTTVFMTINVFRVGWITVLNRRQKFLTFLGGILFTMVGAGLLAAEVGSGVTFADMVNSYSLMAGSFLFLMTIFIFLYSLITTINALLHLPTAAIYDKKVREINSFYNLSRTINSLFDFDKIVTTVTELVCDATNANACWLEMANVKNPTARYQFDFVALKTREGFTVHFLELSSKKYLHKDKASAMIPSNDQDFLSYLAQPVESILQDKKPVLVNQVKRDKRTKDLKRSPIESLIAVPIISYDEVIGIIYAVKSVQFGFDQDDAAIISAFANQTSMAIENTRLLKESLEKERLAQELRIAHEVQMRLIPQEIPRIHNSSKTVMLDIGATTLPASEVGGDYYDFVMLPDMRTGIVVADVSGKGTSAAFYMAEIKGIIQSLAGHYPSPKELLIAVNDVLYCSMDRKSFITLIYADFNVQTGELHFARAGHCPLLHVNSNEHHFLQPSGIGLGLDNGRIFNETIEDVKVKVRHDDIFVLYSDGLIEARNIHGEEFGEERLCQSVERAREHPAELIKESIVNDVRMFVGQAKAHDDLTCVVLKVHNMNKENEPKTPASTLIQKSLKV